MKYNYNKNAFNKIITETLDNHFKNSGLMRIQNSQRMKKLNSRETEVKAFYKDLYRRFEKAFIQSGQEIATRRVQKYLGQSLILTEKIYVKKEGIQLDPFLYISINIKFIILCNYIIYYI